MKGYSRTRAVSATASPGPAAIGSPKSDVALVEAWIDKYDGCDNTQRAYRREGFRFLRWLKVQEVGLLAVNSDIAIRYLNELAREPAQRRVGRAAAARPLSQRSLLRAQQTLVSLFNKLVANQLIGINPFAGSKRFDRGGIREYPSAATRPIMAALFAAAERLPQARGVRDLPAKGRWYLALSVYTGLRPSEIVAGRMSHFTRERLGSTELACTLRVVGKGKISATVPVSEEAWRELLAYRRDMGLTGLPTEDDIPLIFGRGTKPVSYRGLHNLLEQIKALALAGPHGLDELDVERLRRLTPHKLRHTFATLQLQAGGSLHALQQNLRHANLQTTSIYVNADLRARVENVNLIGSLSGRATDRP